MTSIIKGAACTNRNIIRISQFRPLMSDKGKISRAVNCTEGKVLFRISACDALGYGVYRNHGGNLTFLSGIRN